MGVSSLGFSVRAGGVQVKLSQHGGDRPLFYPHLFLNPVRSDKGGHLCKLQVWYGAGRTGMHPGTWLGKTLAYFYTAW